MKDWIGNLLDTRCFEAIGVFDLDIPHRLIDSVNV